MKPFRFRAAALLDLRREQCDAARTELARLTDGTRAAAARVDEAEHARTSAERDYRAVLVGGADADALARHRNWIARQHTIVEERHRALEDCRLAVARQAAIVHDHLRRVRVLERLRDRAWRRYVTEEQRHETKEMDLIAVLQYARRIPEGDSHRDS